MLTKKLTFDQDALDILRGIKWNEGGTVGVLTCGQLDHALYVKVNKALEAMGGKWDRRIGGHIFKLDPRPTVEGLLDSGTLTVEKDGFFETPPDVVRRMLQLVPPRGHILEPSAGLGAIADQIPADRAMILCVEKNPARAAALCAKGYVVECMDFLEMLGPTFETIVMNPPFEEGQDIDHVRHAYGLLTPGGWLVSVMSEGPFFRQDEKAQTFRIWLDDIDGYSEKLDAGAFTSSGSGVNARLVVIH